MATKKQATPGGSASNLAASTPDYSDPAPDITPAGKAIQYGNPIGVAQFEVDPETGKLKLDPDTGEPIPWTATVQHMVGGSGFAGVQTQKVAPRYYEGSVQEILGNMPPELLAQLQAHMVDARVYGSKNPNIVYGIPDQETMSAFQTVLTQANATGYDYETVIQNWGRIAKNAPPPPPTPHIATISNTTDLVATFKKASRSAIGRELSDSEAHRFASVLQGQQAAADQASFALQDAGQSGTVMGAPNPDAFLDTQLRQTPEYGANSIATQFDAFQSLLRGPSLG